MGESVNDQNTLVEPRNCNYRSGWCSIKEEFEGLVAFCDLNNNNN